MTVNAITQEADAIQEIYQAALQPERWHHALSAVMPLVNADAFHFMQYTTAQFSIELSLTSHPKGHEGAISEYESYYGRLDPRRHYFESVAPSTVFVCQDRFSDDYVSRSEFYQDFLLPKGNYRTIGAKVLSRPHRETVLGYLRSRDRGGFSKSDVRAGKRVLEHVSRACRLWADTEKVRADLAVGLSVSQHSAQGLIGLGASGQIVYVNPAAEELLRQRECLSNSSGQLTAPNFAMANVLRRAIKSAMETGVASNLIIPGVRSGSDMCILSIARLDSTTARSMKHSNVCILITAQMRNAPVKTTGRALQDLFGLTRSELAVAIALAEGATPEEYAARAGIGIATVRSHIRWIYEKTQTNRQAELVRLVLRLPQA